MNINITDMYIFAPFIALMVYLSFKIIGLFKW